MFYSKKQQEFLSQNLNIEFNTWGRPQRTAENFTDSPSKPIKYAPLEAKFDAPVTFDRCLP